MHYGSVERVGIHTISSPLATQIPQAAGAAYALKLQRKLGIPLDSAQPGKEPSSPREEEEKGRVVACYFGEGAASEGDFHAGLNIAATRSCPVVFICRNNGYAISTPTLEQYRGDGIASRGVGYGIETIRVDGNDIFAVREAVGEARKRALGKGVDGEGEERPVLVEAMSYRISHHSTSDDSLAYRPKSEVEPWALHNNPITRLRKYLEHKGIWTQTQEEDTRETIREEVLKAMKEAEGRKNPPLRGMWEGVYEELTEDQRREMGEWEELVRRYPGEYEGVVGGFVEGREGLRPRVRVG